MSAPDAFQNRVVLKDLKAIFVEKIKDKSSWTKIELPRLLEIVLLEWFENNSIEEKP